MEHIEHLKNEALAELERLAMSGDHPNEEKALDRLWADVCREPEEGERWDGIKLMISPI